MGITRVGPRRRRGSGQVTMDLLTTDYVELSLNGVRASRSAIVKDLIGVTTQRLYNAVTAAGIPQAGDLDPVLGVPVSAVRAEFMPDSPTKARVIISYGFSRDTGFGFFNLPDDDAALPYIEIIATLQPVTTQFDVNGNLLLIDNYIETDPETQTSSAMPPQAGEVEYMLPMHTVIARRRESISPGLVKSPQFTGTINSSIVFGDAPHMWMASVDGVSDDGGKTYNVTYTFQRNPDTWNALIVYRDPETGLPAKDTTHPGSMVPGSAGNGTKVSQIYPATDFRGLGINIFGPSTP